MELEPEDLRQPDLFVVSSNEARRVLRDGNPIRKLQLAIEVLSPSSTTASFDLELPSFFARVWDE